MEFWDIYDINKKPTGQYHEAKRLVFKRTENTISPYLE